MNKQPEQPEPVRAFCKRVESYLDRTGMRPTRLGEGAVGDPNFVTDLREGREPRFSTIERVDRFMTEHPDGDAKEAGSGPEGVRLAGCG